MIVVASRQGGGCCLDDVPCACTRSLSIALCPTPRHLPFRTHPSQGASMLTVTSDGCNLLHHCRNSSLVPRIVAAGVDLEQRNLKGRTPLLEAATRVEPICVAPLIELGANLNAVDDAGCTALHLLARTWGEDSSEDAIKLLLSKGLQVDRRDSAGRTPLMYAAAVARQSKAKLLLAHGASVAARTLTGATALHLVGEAYDQDEHEKFYADEHADAVLSFCTDTLHALVEAGADPHAEDADWQNPLGAAVGGGNVFAALSMAASGERLRWLGCGSGMHANGSSSMQSHEATPCACIHACMHAHCAHGPTCPLLSLYRSVGRQ